MIQYFHPFRKANGIHSSLADVGYFHLRVHSRVHEVTGFKTGEISSIFTYKQIPQLDWI